MSSRLPRRVGSLGIGQEVAELAVALAANGLIQRHRRFGGTQSLFDVNELVSRSSRQLFLRGLTSMLQLELPSQPSELQPALVNVRRESDRL